eukprot:Filipodium_phascolosomae@DN4410_c0_g1_i1.p1
MSGMLVFKTQNWGIERRLAVYPDTSWARFEEDLWDSYHIPRMSDMKLWFLHEDGEWCPLSRYNFDEAKIVADRSPKKKLSVFVRDNPYEHSSERDTHFKRCTGYMQYDRSGFTNSLERYLTEREPTDPLNEEWLNEFHTRPMRQAPPTDSFWDKYHI